nr:L-ascorbate oxidase-like [Ipomoea batatas]
MAAPDLTPRLLQPPLVPPQDHCRRNISPTLSIHRRRAQGLRIRPRNKPRIFNRREQFGNPKSIGHKNHRRRGPRREQRSPTSPRGKIELRRSQLHPPNHPRALAEILVLSPKILVLVEQDFGHNSPFFPSRFMEALQYYSSIFDSLDAMLPKYDTRRAKIEQFYFMEEIKNIMMTRFLRLCLLVLAIFASANSVEAKVRHYKWDVKYEFKSPDCYKKLAITINGKSPGPTIVAQQGDTVVVEVKNSLLTENLAIHWHGIRQEQTANPPFTIHTQRVKGPVYRLQIHQLQTPGLHSSAFHLSTITFTRL